MIDADLKKENAAGLRTGAVEKGLALFFLAFSAFYLHSAVGYSFGTPASPRAGFLPTLVGWAAVVLTSINVFRTFRRPTHAAERRGDAVQIQTRSSLVILLLVGLAGYVFLLQAVGFLPAAFIGLLYLLKVSGTPGLVLPLCLAAGISGGLFVAFRVLLGVPLP